MFSRKTDLIQSLYAEIRRLREALKELQNKYEDMRGIAENAIQTAREIHFPTQPVEVSDPDSVIRSRANYNPPEVKFCPQCSVSVRSVNWPQECPACHSVFGFDEN